MSFAVLWDMDGTLVDSEPLHEQTLVLLLNAQGLQAPPDLHQRTVGQPESRVHAMFCEELGLALPLAQWTEMRCRLYLERAAQLQARAGAIAVFAELHSRGVPQAVVSNSDRLIVDANLRAIGLARSGFTSVSRNDVRDGKPEPEPYRRAAWLLQREPAECCVVEDSAAGARAGLAAGCRTLYWPQLPSAGPPGAAEIADVAQLRHHLGLGA